MSKPARKKLKLITPATYIIDDAWTLIKQYVVDYFYSHKTKMRQVLKEIHSCYLKKIGRCDGRCEIRLWGDEGAQALARALRMNSPVDINISKIGDEGGKAIGEALRVNTSLTQISLGWNNIGDEGGKAIGEALKVNTSLAKIWLCGNKIGDEGGKAIGEALKVNTSLTHLDLRSNPIGDEVIMAIIRAWTSSQRSLWFLHYDGENGSDYETECL